MIVKNVCRLQIVVAFQRCNKIKFQMPGKNTKNLSHLTTSPMSNSWIIRICILIKAKKIFTQKEKESKHSFRKPAGLDYARKIDKRQIQSITNTEENHKSPASDWLLTFFTHLIDTVTHIFFSLRQFAVNMVNT